MTKSAIRLTPDGWPRVGGSPWGESDDMTSDLRRRLFRDKAPVRRATPSDFPEPLSKPLVDAFHANLLTVARAWLEMLKTGSSAAKGVADVQVTWPSGTTSTYRSLGAGRYHELVEPAGAGGTPANRQRESSIQ